MSNDPLPEDGCLSNFHENSLMKYIYSALKTGLALIAKCSALLSLAAACHFAPLHWFKSLPCHVRKLPVTWG